MPIPMPQPEGPRVAPGHAHLTVETVDGQSTVTAAFSSSPIRILIPKSRGLSAWAYTSSFGGGMVGGDRTRLDLHLGPQARCFVGTQASTKIYRNPSRAACSHVTQARLEAEALLVWAPDPVQAFADSTYSQHQVFDLAPGAGLVLVDWFSSGRAARGERWKFSRFKSRNEVLVGGERLFLDSILLDAAGGPLDSPVRAGRFNGFATVLIVGEPWRAAAQQLLEHVSGRPVERQSPLVISASPIRDGAVLRLAGEDLEAIGREIRGHLGFVCDVLGDDPWARRG